MRWMLAATVLMIPAAASAQAMNAETFHQRATALQKKGPMALFSGGEIKTLMREGQASGKAAKDRYNADKAAGRATRFCPPPGQQKLGSDEYIKRLAAIPFAERRRIDMAEATTQIMASKFPCRG